VLVNSAGAARRTPHDELQPQAWHDAMQAKFFTYIHVLDPVVKRMGAHGAAPVVNVVGMGGKVATTTHLAGRRGQRGADARHRRPGGGLGDRAACASTRSTRRSR
jgi:hypothetical protein